MYDIDCIWKNALKLQGKGLSAVRNSKKHYQDNKAIRITLVNKYNPNFIISRNVI